jgi:tetratricopeptide (TPR) repeat protein
MSQALFVGREQELQFFQAFLQKDKPWVLSITGLGGSGKSTLLRHLATDIAIDTPYITLNFGNEHLRNDPLSILESLATQLTPYSQNESVGRFQETLQHGREEITWLHQQLQPLVVVSDRAHWHVTKESDERAAREVHLQVRARVVASFYEQVDTFRMPRLLMLFDTCEWLIEAQNLEVGRWLLNELIPEIHTRLQANHRRCIAVIASRMQLPLETIHRTEQSCLTLSLLDHEGVDQYLRSIGMSNDQMRENVYGLTHGHPLCMSIIAGFWQERGELSFDLSNFPMLEREFNQQALLQFIQKRLDAHLASPYRELTHYGVLLRSFTLSLLQAVFPELLPLDEALEIFHRLISYPYIEYLGDQRYTFHDLLREIQVTHIRERETGMWQQFHERALVFLTQVSPFSPDWYYHALACREEKTMSEWLLAGQITQREHLEALIQAASDKTLKLTPLSQAKRAHQRGYFYYHEMRIAEALSSYQEALSLYRHIEDHQGEANVLQTIGDIQQFRKDMPSALDSYEQALRLFRQVEDRLGEANVHKAIGDVQRFRDDQEKALASYEQALSLFRQVGSSLGEANVLQAIGDVQQFRKEMEAALTSYEQALSLFRQVGSSLGEANVLQAIGDVQQFRKEMEAALTSYEQALSLFRQVGSSLGEANVLQAIGDVQQFRMEMETALASYEQTLKLFRQVGDRLGEANALQAIGDVQRFRKNMSSALASYEQALSLFRQVGDRLGEANALQAIGDVQQFRDERENALASYEQALSLFRQVGDRLGEANALQAIGDVQQFRMEMATALASYREALDLYQKVGSSLGIANCHLALGFVALQQDEYPKALALYDRAYQLYQQIQDEFSQARLLFYRSIAYEALNDAPHALKDAEQGLVMAQSYDLPFADAFQQRLEALQAIP